MRLHPARTALVLALLLAAGPSGASAGPAAPEASAELDRRIDAVTSGGSPGMVVLVARGGRLLYSRAAGVTDLASRSPIGIRTPFYVASVGKAFTATALLMLADQRRVGLDSTLGSHLDGLPAWAGRVTLRQMLAHTSGIPDHYDLLGGEEAAEGLSNDDVVKLMKGQESLLFEPGTRWGYSNSAYVLLARVIEKITGKPLRVALDEMIFGPLEMTATSVLDGSAPPPEGRARGYLPGTEDGPATVPADYRQTTTGAGGVYSSAEDLLKFARAYHGGRLLKPATRKAAISEGRLAGGGRSPFSLGWQVEDFVDGPLKGELYVAQFGMLRGFRAVLFYVPKDGLTCIMLSNSGRGPGFPSEIAGLFLREQ